MKGDPAEALQGLLYCILKQIIRQRCERKLAERKQKKRARLDQQESYMIFSIILSDKKQKLRTMTERLKAVLCGIHSAVS